MKKKRSAAVFGLTVFLIIWLAPAHVFGWGNTWIGNSLEAIVSAARLKAGPFQYSAALSLDNAGYDSDIYYGSTSTPVPDYTFSAGPELRIFLPLKKKVVFDLSESPRYVFYRRTKRERTLNNAFQGQVHVVFDRFYIQAGGALTNAKQRLSTELNIPVRLNQNTLAGMILWQASKQTSFALQYTRAAYKYEDDASEVSSVSESLDRTESTVSCTAYLQQQARVRYYLDGVYGSYSFSREVSRFKDSRSYSVYGGLEFLPPAGGYEGQTSGIRGRVNLGYRRFDVLDPQQKDFDGIVGDTRVSIGIVKQTAVQVLFSRGPQFSLYSGLSFYLQTAFGAGLTRSLSRRILFTYDLYYGRNDYPSGVTIGGNLLDKRVDEYLNHFFRLSFRLRRDLEISLLTNLGRRRSKLAPQPVSEQDFFGFSLLYGYLSGGLSMQAGRYAR